MPPSYRLSLRDNVLVAQEGTALVLRGPWAGVVLRDLSPGLAAAVRALAGGGEAEADLQDRLVRGEGPQALAVLRYYLGELDRQGLVQRTVPSRGRPLLTLVPTSRYAEFVPPKVDPKRRYVLCPFAYARREDGALILESPLAYTRIVLHGSPATAVLHALAAPAVPAELARRAAVLSEDALGLLLAAGMVRDDDGTRPPNWRFCDLVLHASSRLRRHDRALGAVYPFAGVIAPPPALEAVEAVASWQPLARPDPCEPGQERSLGDVLVAHACRPGAPATTILDARVLGQYLFRTARVRQIWDTVVPSPHGPVRLQLVSRPYAAGGSLYELDLFPVVRCCTGVAAGLHYYEPLGHRLGLVCPPGSLVGKVTSGVAAAAGVAVEEVQVILLVAARFERRAWKYASTAYANLLKDLGVLSRSLELAAVAAGLTAAVVPAGGLHAADGDLLAAAIGSEPQARTAIGAVLLAGPR